jgi:hypothetical protein
MDATWVPDVPFKATTHAEEGTSLLGLLTLVPPVLWMITVSLTVIAMKWLIVGVYRPGNLGFNTWGFIRWWVVEYAIRLWETFVGTYILGSPYIALFYRLMGANISVAPCHATSRSSSGGSTSSSVREVPFWNNSGGLLYSLLFFRCMEPISITYALQLAPARRLVYIQVTTKEVSCGIAGGNFWKRHGPEKVPSFRR